MKKKTIYLAFTLAFSFCLMAGVDSMAQERTVATPEKKSRGEALVLPDDSKPVAKPDFSKARGTCCLDFDNWTGYYIDVWVDSEYRGRVSPWEDGDVCVGDGWTTWQAKTAGGTYSWSGSGACSSYVTIKLE
jgi:hypothetical protein